MMHGPPGAAPCKGLWTRTASGTTEVIVVKTWNREQVLRTRSSATARRPWACVVWSALLGGLAAEATAAARVGDVVDLAAFGVPFVESSAIGVEWTNPRDVHEVRVLFKEAPAALETLRLEWWGSVWPANGTGGWMKLDDPWNGQWVRVAAAAASGGQPNEVAFRLPPLTKAEWKNALEPSAYPGGREPSFRRTLKVRVVRDGGPLPEGARIGVLGSSRWREAAFDVDCRLPQDGTRSGRVEVINGELAGIESLPPPRAVSLRDSAWSAAGVAGQSAGIRIHVLYAANDNPTSNDLTRVTLRFGEAADATGFSFVPQDVLKDGAMRVPDFGVLVAESSRGLTIANDPGVPPGYWAKTVRQRVAERPETTRASAMAGIPRLRPARWVPIGVPSARQEIVVGPNGDWSMWHQSLWTEGRDTQRSPFRKANTNLDAILDTSPEPRFKGSDREQPTRCLEDDWLPLIHVEWRTGPIRYHHALAATILLGEIGDDDARRGDETVVLLTRLDVTNTATDAQTATVNLRYSHDAPIALRDDGVIAIEPSAGAVPAGLTAVRGQIVCAGAADRGIRDWTVLPPSGNGASAVLRWQAALAPGEKRTIYFKQPYVDLLDAEELARLREISFEREVPKVLEYWRGRLAAGMAMDVPDAAMRSFYAANLWHILITTDRDPKTGLYNQGVGTFAYRVFANETIMIARSMDMRGEHKEAERFIEPLLHYQGSEALKGRFSTKEGAFHGAGEYTHGEYAMNHGFVLWGAADHYFTTRDRAYLDRVAPKLVRGCDFLIHERKSTLTPEGRPRLPYHGLAPASSLEDVVEYQYWFATNGFFHLGLRRAAEALADIGHPEAPRLRREAEAYRRDIEIAVREAATRTAAVRLRDGRFIPYVPSRVYHWRHLTEGWIREALYPSLHLAVSEVVSPDDPLITWMLDELEDNIFFSAESGYNVPNVDRDWFEKGAVTLQPCLVDTPYLYMVRNEIPAALRSFWNTYALSIYPDVHCFAEWAKAFGVGGGPVYKTSDEARFVMWLRQFLICEEGDALWFGRAVPRQWLEHGKAIRVERAQTFFGPAGLTIRSETDRGRIHAELSLPSRNPPAEVWLRLRHPAARHPVRVLLNDRPIAADRILGEDIRLKPGEEATASPVRITAEYAD